MAESVTPAGAIEARLFVRGLKRALSEPERRLNAEGCGWGLGGLCQLGHWACNLPKPVPKPTGFAVRSVIQEEHSLSSSSGRQRSWPCGKSRS